MVTCPLCGYCRQVAGWTGDPVPLLREGDVCRWCWTKGGVVYSLWDPEHMHGFELGLQ